MCNELNIFIFMYQLFVNPALIIYIKEVYMVLLYIKFKQANYLFQTLMILKKKFWNMTLFFMFNCFQKIETKTIKRQKKI